MSPGFDYHASGAVNAVFFALALFGLFSQWRKILVRRVSAAGRAQGPTAILSLNQFAVSFLGYYAFFVYGYSVEPFNPYLVWPRMIGSLLVLLILLEIARDRRSSSAIRVFGAALLLMTGGVVVLILAPDVSVRGRAVPQILAVVAAVLIVQGFAHQVALIRRSGRTGAVSLRMHVLTYLKDLSTLVFGFVMGLGSGWPLILMGGASIAIKSVLLWQFRWVRRSPLARARRDRIAAPPEARLV